MSKHTRDQKARETKSEKEIPCIQSRSFIHGKDFSSTIHQPWLLKAGDTPVRDLHVEESVVPHVLSAVHTGPYHKV